MCVSGSGYRSSLTRPDRGGGAPGSRSIILGWRCAASRATTLPKPHSVAPAISPPRSFSTTCPPRVSSHKPFSGAASASVRPCTSASALAPACLTSCANSPVVASGPCPSNAARCTMPLSGTSEGSPSKTDRHDSRSSGSTSAPAKSTVWLRADSPAASCSATPLRSPASTQTPGGSTTSAGPCATMTPLSGSADADASSPSTSASTNPALASDRRHTAGPARAWCGRNGSANRHQPSSWPNVRSIQPWPRRFSRANSWPDGASRVRQCPSVSSRKRVAWSTFDATTRS